MKIASKRPGITVKSVKPNFKYQFKNPCEPVEINEEHAEKILKNSNFYIVSEKVKKEQNDSWINELTEIKGVGKKIAMDIAKCYPTKTLLLNALKNHEILPFRDDIGNKLREEYID
jgi:Holliday junction resolvasome RuvABC DNA-binding subunit